MNVRARAGPPRKQAGHTSWVSNEQRSDADHLAAAADDLEAGQGPVAVSRPGRYRGGGKSLWPGPCTGFTVKI
jgi:hypothetical protein